MHIFHKTHDKVPKREDGYELHW